MVKEGGGETKPVFQPKPLILVRSNLVYSQPWKYYFRANNSNSHEGNLPLANYVVFYIDY